MHSDPALVERLFRHLPEVLTPKKMFGGQCWMLNGNMCIGVYKEFLITRIGVEAYKKIADNPHIYPMDITGKPMKGWAKIEQAAIKSDADLKRQIGLAVSFVETLPGK